MLITNGRDVDVVVDVVDVDVVDVDVVDVHKT